jgi:hypothetical protein
MLAAILLACVIITSVRKSTQNFTRMRSTSIPPYSISRCRITGPSADHFGKSGDNYENCKSGLRCPSEHLGLHWGDVDWNCNRLTVHSPKTKRHQGKAKREIPIFPELLPHLEAALSALLENFDPKANRLSEQPVITRYRDTNANLRTHFCRIIRKANLEPWPKLFQNLRSTRATELAAQFPEYVAAEWLGHSTAVANKHYWRVTDADFEKAVPKAQQKAQQNLSDDDGIEQHTSEQKCEKPGDYENHRVPLVGLVLPVGLEPTTY